MNAQQEHDRVQADAGRRNFLKLTGVTIAGLGVTSVASSPAFAVNVLGWDKVFPQSDKVVHEKVTYYNRLGINIVLPRPQKASTSALNALHPQQRHGADGLLPACEHSDDFAPSDPVRHR
jgi:hypothetical protein